MAATTADLLAAREAIPTHMYLCEDRLNHPEAMRLLGAALDVAFEVGRAAERAANQRKALNEQYRRADGSLDLPKPGSQYGARLDAERSEAMRAAK